MADKETILTYKGRPLVRSGNTLYYGDMADEHVVVMQILATETVKELSVATKVQVQMMATDPELPLNERFLKKSEKAGLYEALDIASIWLDRVSKG
ncbi:MAG: hypothetical protein E7549_05265 [Ruminococcaceae bacterium]|nr:hypothetical protein [Oscillospiraceae bacterium]